MFMQLPDGLRVAEDAESLCEFPAEPKVPPKTAIEESLGSLSRAVSVVPVSPDTKSVVEKAQRTIYSNVSSFTIKRTNSFEVHFHVKQLKHNFQIKLDTLFLVFDSWDTAKSFSMDYRILAGNVPQPTKDKLHVIVEISELK